MSYSNRNYVITILGYQQINKLECEYQSYLTYCSHAAGKVRMKIEGLHTQKVNQILYDLDIVFLVLTCG